MKTNNPYSVKLRIADIIIKMRSRFALEQVSDEENRQQASERFKNFLYKGKKGSHILIEVEIVDKLPKLSEAKPIFITYHFQDGSENWRLLRKGKSYIYMNPLENKKQIMLVNGTFDRVTAYLLTKKDKGKVWNIGDIIYDFLQVLLINYVSQRNQGIFTHSVGIRDLDGKGLLFTGKSGCGKTTLARLWYKHSKAMVLNDDRIIVCKINGKFFIYGSPWHGDFSDYLTSHIESAQFTKLFFIHHSPKNILRPISEKKAFQLLYPNLFPTFWDKKGLENIVSFCSDLVKNIPCYSLGFKNDKQMIEFVRKIK